jgi:protein O-GlcNAc transferase
MKVVSFSLYGENPIYCAGCIKNAILKKSIFKDWEMWVYHNDTVPKSVLEDLEKLNVKLINTNEFNDFFGSLWRFRVMDTDNIEFFISRDCDSRISERDEVAVQEWIESGKSFHIIREHPIGHTWPINAGMWGAKGGSIPNLRGHINNYLLENPRFYDKTIDQCFLSDIIYAIALKDVFLHDEYYNPEGFGTNIKRDRVIDNFAFIGESVDENDEPRGDQRTPIKNMYNSKL